MRGYYADTPEGQVHLRLFGEPGAEDAPALLCLHPMPYSGLFYSTIAPLLAAERMVICPDYPGYGNSPSQAMKPTISDWAGSMLMALKSLDLRGAVDVLGFHTGCLVGPEMVRLQAQSLRRMVLVDVPYFDAEGRQAMLRKIGAAPEFTEDVRCIEGAWKMNVASRLGKVEVNRCMALLAELLRTGTQTNAGYTAAFSYNSEPAFERLGAETLIIATDSGLYQPSQDAAKLTGGASFISAKAIKAPAFETGAQALADMTLQFLKQ